MPIRSAHAGEAPEGYDVTTTGTRVAVVDEHHKYWSCANSSATDAIYLALQTYDEETMPSNPASVGRGIYLAPNGGVFELNSTNMYRGEIWAIHGGTGTARLCVQAGK